MSIANNIKRLREQKGLTQEELARALGMSRPAVTQWETGWSQPRMGTVEKLAAFFGVPKSEIIDDAPAHPDLPADAIPARPSTATAPLLGWVHAGSPEDERVLDGGVELPEAVLVRHPHGFFLRVEGDCMDRRFPEGCHVFVDPEASPWNGCAVAAELPGYAGVLRSYYRGQSSLMLCADSFSEYEDIILTGDDPVRLIGVVVWFQADGELSDG